jgi:hypothetical protein
MRCSDSRWPMTGSTAERRRCSRLIFGVIRRFWPDANTLSAIRNRGCGRLRYFSARPGRWSKFCGPMVGALSRHSLPGGRSGRGMTDGEERPRWAAEHCGTALPTQPPAEAAKGGPKKSEAAEIRCGGTMCDGLSTELPGLQLLAGKCHPSSDIGKVPAG